MPAKLAPPPSIQWPLAGRHHQAEGISEVADQKVTPFVFEGETVRVIERDGELWFVTADVCRAVGISNPRDAVGKLDEDEKGVAFTDTPGGRQEVSVVSESGLHTLILRSHAAVKRGTLPHRFRRWVTGEVLPAVRRAGEVASVQAPGRDRLLPEALALRVVREGRRVFGVRAAGQLWFATGLPVVPAMRLPPPQLDLFGATSRPDASLNH